MVGSGFTKNAEGQLPGHPQVPDWTEIASGMHERLYQHHLGTQDLRIRGPSSDRAPSIAQEYASVFGRMELHRYLEQQVADAELAPGQMHMELLRMPWADVFTTNWDTLLERASAQVARRYDVVRNASSIPLAVRPRIVKLHGSLPDHFPLIVTAEDYRRYPIDFAPFVNTVQQAMMETVFLLIGFSGTDPNFLHWSGWVRDQLGTLAPRIYLAGWLQLSQHERRVLESRNVIPIDLASHPRSREWLQQSAEHRLTAEWIVESLKLGRPYSPTRWPQTLDTTSSRDMRHLEPIPKARQEMPRVEHDFPPDENDTQWKEKVRGALKDWAHNRTLFPGWLIIPAKRVYAISSRTRRWEKVILKFLDDEELPIEAKLSAVYELIWRKELLLEPLGDSLANVAKQLLQQVLPRDQQASHASPVEPEQIARIALALVTHARLHSSDVEFEKACEIAIRSAPEDRDARHRLSHEQCLRSLYALDFEAVRKMLNQWATEEGDPIWKVRKAALMLELRDRGPAIDLLTRAASTLRRGQMSLRSVGAMSRDAWLDLFLSKFEETPDSGLNESRVSRSAASANADYDAQEELSAYKRLLQPRDQVEHVPPFELGATNAPTISFRGDEYSISGPEAVRVLAAYRAIRLGEIVGLPPIVEGWDMTTQVMAQAAEVLHAYGQKELALRTMLRISSSGDNRLLKKLLSRVEVATLSEGLADSLSRVCESVVEHALQDNSPSAKGQIRAVDRLRVALEVQSRLILRLDPSCANKAFEKALFLYRDSFVSSSVLLRDPVNNLLTRSWEALPQNLRAQFTFDVLKAPIATMDGFARELPSYPEPGMLLEDKTFQPPTRTSDNEQEWSSCVDFLVRGLRAGPKARERAKLRLAHMAIWDIFSNSEKTKVAEALWNLGQEHEEVAADEKWLRDWALILLPQPKPDRALEHFKRKWSTGAENLNLSAEQQSRLLFEIGDFMANSEVFDYSMNLSTDDRAAITDLVDRWACSPVPPNHPVFDGYRRREIRQAIDGVSNILFHMDVPMVLATALYQKCKQYFLQEDVPGYRLLVSLTKYLPNNREATLTELRKGLASTNRDLARDASVSLLSWLRMSKRSLITPPALDLIREIGIIVATRRPPALAEALAICAWTFSSGTQEQMNEIRKLVLEGLAYLIHELGYQAEISPKDMDIPLLRWRGASVAKAMRDAGEAEDILSEWEQLARDDPLPEIRHGISFAPVSTES